MCEKSLGDNSGILGIGVQQYGENMWKLVLICVGCSCVCNILDPHI